MIKKKITIFLKEVLFITNMFKIPFSFTGYYNKRYYRPKTIIKKGTFLSRFLTPTVTYEIFNFFQLTLRQAHFLLYLVKYKQFLVSIN